MSKSDYEQARELISVYANALDVKDYAGVGACFTEDATVGYAGFSGLITGREPILDHMRLALDPLDQTQHLFGNFIVDIDGDTGRLQADIMAQHVKRGVPGGETYMAGGHYDVGLRKVGGAWKMASVSANSRWGDGNRDLLPKS